MQAHIIFCNNGIKLVVVGEHKIAVAKMDELKKESFERYWWMGMDRGRYESLCHWHIMTYECIVEI